MEQCHNHTDPKIRQGQQHRQELAPYLSKVPSVQNAGNAAAKKYIHTSISTLLSMTFDRNTRHALHCRRSPPALLPASE